MTKKRIDSIKKYTATSLEQLLISVLISSIIILILFEIYSVVKKQSFKIAQQIQVLYNQNIADFYLRTQVNRSGYKGLLSTLPLHQYTSIPISHKAHIIPKAPIAVCKATVASCKNFVPDKILDKIINHKIKDSTDVLLIYDIPEKVTYLTEDMPEYSSPLTIALQQNVFAAGDHMIVADSKFIQRFILSDMIDKKLTHDKPFNTTNNFVKKFQSGAEVFRVKCVAFYIAKNYRYKNSQVYSLYMDDLSRNRAEAILDNIDNLLVQVLMHDSNMQLVNASNLGWIFNEYILIKLLFKNKVIEQNFVTGIEVKNNGQAS